MSTPPEDTGLPQRLRALAVIREGEERIGRSWFRSLTRFFDRIRPRVLRDGGVDPGRVSDEQQFWTDQVNVEVVPVIGSVLGDAWRRVTASGQPRTDPWVAQYLNQAGNRLVRVPDEVYALIVREVERGITEGLSHDNIAVAVREVLTSTGSEYWRGRAMTVARTETMGAVNAGVFRAAELEAEQRGDVAPFKMWLATDDTRTRPTHREADRQRTLMSEPFRVGSAQLLFPGDPTGPAVEVINCRCTVVPVVLGEELDWTDRQTRGARDGA